MKTCLLYMRLALFLGVSVFVSPLWAGDVALTDGQNAEDVVGQTDAGGAGVFTQGTPFSSKELKGFNLPYFVAIDTVSHRLFVSDRSANRITEYDLDSSNALADLAADHVLGQTNFYGRYGGLAQNRLYNPGQVYFDPGSDRLFVADYSNYRVLIFDVAAITDGENAVNVLGQSNYTTATSGLAVNKLSSPYSTRFDPGTNRLFVSDILNHRVTVFDLAVVTDGENAVNVLGQSDFTTNTTGLTQSGMNAPYGIEYDASTSRLYVADYNNRRVMVFDVAVITDGENAINVLGQPNFTTNTNSTSQNYMTYPTEVLIDKTTQRLFVSELTNRILVYDVNAITDGENAVNVLGQTTYTSGTANFTKNTIYYPRGLAFDEGGNRLYVADSLNNRVMEFNVSTTTIANGENAENVLGQTDGAGGAVYTTPNVFDGLAQDGLDYPYSVIIDTVSHRLFVADYYTNRVVEYDLDPSNTLVDRTIDHFLGQTTVYRNLGTVSQSSVYSPSGLAFDPATNRLFVSNYTGDRVTVYDVATLTDNENAINVLGQPNFNASTIATTQSGMKYPQGLSFEANGSRLYVADSSNNRVLVYDVASITNGENAVNVLGQPDFTSAGNGTSAITMNTPYFVNHDGGTRLFVGDRYNNRILVFDTTAITDGENAVNVLGQANFTTATPGAAQNKLSNLYGVSSDRLGNRLFVSDLNNSRIMTFDTSVITDGENAVNVLGQTNFTATTSGTAQNKLDQPCDLSYESGMNRLYVADRMNNRILSYSVGPVPPSTSTLTATTGFGAGAVNLSWPSAGDDGAFNNLTGYYRIQYATYTATWSTSTTPTGAFTSTITATNVVPGVVQSTSIVVSPTTVQPWFFVIWTQDDASNWSAISSTVSASPPYVAPSFGVGPFDVTSVAGGLSQGGTAWGDFDNDGDLDVAVSGIDGTNNQVRAYKNIGNGTFSSTVVNVAAANAGLKDGDVAFGDYDNDGDLDVLVSGTDNTNNQLRVYKNNGNGTFNTTAIEVAGSNNGLKQGGVAWGDYDNDGDLDVLVSGTDGTNNQLRVFKNKGDATFDSTAINVAGSNNGLKQGSVAWGDFDKDGDLDVLVGGTDSTNRQLRVYANNGNGTFNATAINVAGSNNGLADGRAVWGDFDKDGDLDVLVSGTDGTNNQLRTYSNNGNGTFNATATNVAGSNGGVTNSAVAVGDYNVDGNLDILSAGRPNGLVGYWKFDENTGTSVADLSGQSNTGTLFNSPTWVSGKYGQALSFNGSNQYISVGSGSNLGSTRYTISAWVNVNGSVPLSSGRIVVRRDPSSWWFANYIFSVSGDGGGANAGRLNLVHVRPGPGAVDIIDGTSDLRGAGWKHVVGTYDGSNLRIYVNGVLDSSKAAGDPETAGSQTFFMGMDQKDVEGYYFPGKIDEPRIYNRALSDGEVAGLYQATKSSIGTLRIHKGVGDGTFNAIPVEVDNGLEKGQVAWGDTDGDGDLDILTSGSDSSTPQLQVYLSTQSLTVSNTAPSAPGTLTGTFSFSASTVSVASFTWTAGTDSGTGSTSENGLSYDIRISTKSDFSLLLAPGEEGASPRLGSYLKPPKIFSGSTAYGVMLKSTDPWNAQSGASFGLRTDTTYYYQVKTVDAGLAISGWSASGMLNTVAAPSTSTIMASTTAVPGTITLSWSSAGDDSMIGNLTGNYRVQYATYTPTWSTSTTPANATTVTIATTSMSPGSLQFASLSGLLAGTTHYIVLWTQDDASNWSTISNTTSVLSMGEFDTNQIEVDGANNGLRYSAVAWGDFDNDGDPDILTSGSDGTNKQLRVYKNNGNGTMDPVQIEVDGASGGLQEGGVAWGDFDNDGDLDILANGTQSTTGQLRIYKNNGNSTFDATQIEVEAINAGLMNGRVAWGDFDNDGDLDVLANGGTVSTTFELRVYKNNGNGTMDASQLEVEARDAGFRLGSVAWGDFDNDGDLDILTSGINGTRELRIYKNNGNGSFDVTQIEVDGAGNGLSNSSVNWGDFDTDGDLDILVSGTSGTNGQLRVYKNNGNGTLDAAQIEVDSLNGGLDYSDAAWGDFDNDGDLDMVTSGYDGTNRQLRIYKNNGNATFDANQIDVDGASGGLQEGGVAWADYDADSDLDILASGYDGSNNQLRIYKNLSAVANTAPSAPATLTASWDYSATGLSTATFKWVSGVDNGAAPTAANGLTYQVEISTTSGFTGKSFVPGQWATPGMGNYLKPPKIYDGNTTHGLGLRYLPLTNTTYYYRVKTIDASLKESAWSATGSLYTSVASSAPSAVTDFAAGEFGEGQIGLSWTAPLNIQSGSSPAYNIRYSTTGAITDDTEFNNATAVTGEPTPGETGTPHLLGLTGLDPLKTYYFGIKSTNGNGTSPLDTMSPRPSAVASPFNATQIEVDGLNGGTQSGTVDWGDFDIDGDLDILLSGSGQLRVYKNNGNGTIDPAQIEVDGAGNGLTYSAWGDFDNDGDLDILTGGRNGSSPRQLRVYKNNGNGTFDPTQIEVDGLNNGLNQGGVAWGDFDNDGDLDILASGTDGTNNQLRVYMNNGNGTFDATQLEVDGLNGGLYDGVSVWGDHDGDGDLDILFNGYDGANAQLRVYKNNGNGTFDGAQIEVDGLNGGLYAGTVSWGDFDGDGDLDILGSGYNSGNQLRVYKNNGNGTFDQNQVELDGANGGLTYGSATWGDYDNDGDLDVVTSGYRGGTKYHMRVYNNNGNGTFNSTQIEVDGLYGGFFGRFAWGDFDTDGDLDILVNGLDANTASQLRIYTNLTQTANTAPTAPSTLSGAFTYDPAGVSVASMTWNAGTDSGTGATAENVLTYDLQISTVSNFSPLLFPGQLGASPRMGSYLKPPKIFNSNTNYGVVLKSTDPWNAQATASYGLRTDTTYYYRVKTVDSALAESAWSGSGAFNTGISPSTSTLSAATGVSAGQVALTWNAAGDDGMLGNLTGTYRIQYATFSAVWSAGGPPAGVTTLTISTTNVVPGVVQSTSVAGLAPGTLYYFALFTGDEVPTWSNVSNTVSALPLSTVSLAEAVGQPGWIGQGETQRILGTAQVVSDSAVGITVSSVAVRETGSYTADGNLTNAEVWLSSSGYIDATAVRLDGTSKSFSGDLVAFDQDVAVSTTPLYFIARADVGSSATEGTFDISLQLYTTASTTNNPIAFSNTTDVVAPPSGSPSGLTATAASNLLQVNLSWGAATGAETYSIYRATHSGVATTDYLVGMTNGTSFADDYIPPAQQMYYKIMAANRAGSTTSGAANATSVDVPALTTSDIYLRAGSPGGFGDGNPAFQQSLNGPYGMAVDQAGNIYIADTSNHRLRFVPKVAGTYFGQAMVANNVYTIAGTGVATYSGDTGPATAGAINGPIGVSVDGAGNIYIADTGNNRIRFIPKTSATYFGQSMTANCIYTIAGNGTASYGGDTGAATVAQINVPTGVAVDLSGNVYVSDLANNRVRFIAKTTGNYFGQSMTANYIYTIAGDGTGTFGGDGGAATAAQLYNPYRVSVDLGGSVYIADQRNNRIRFVAKTAGTYFGQSMAANCISTIAGNGTAGAGGDGGLATSANLYWPTGVTVDGYGNVLIADYSINKIRFVPKTSGTYFGQVMTANFIYKIAGSAGVVGYTGDGGLATSARLDTCIDVSVDPSGNAYIADKGNNRIRFIPKSTGANYGQAMTASYIYTIAGGGSGGFGGDGQVANITPLRNPYGMSVDGSGNIYVADYTNSRVRFVPKTGGTYFGQTMTANYIYTIAGNGTGGYGGDSGLATSAQVNLPARVVLDGAGNVYIADQGNHRIRFIPKTGGTYFGQTMTANYIYTIAGNGTAGYVADDVAATSTQINSPYGVSVDGAGNVYIADQGNHRIRFIPKTGGTYFGQTMTANYIYTIAGNGTAGYVADDVAATSTQINTPNGVAVDVAGNIYISDKINHRIRFVPKTGGTYFGQSMTANYIYTIAGTGLGGYVADGVAATTTKIYFPNDVSVDTGGNVYIADRSNNRIRFIPKKSGMYFGQSCTANFIYTIGGTGSTVYNGENAAATGKNINSPYGLFAGPDHMVYLTDVNHKIRMIAGEDFIAPSTSTLAVAIGVEQATLSWNSAGDDNVNLGNLTGSYRIQYATYTASWSTASTPTDATTVTLSTTSAVPGSAQSYTATGLTAGLIYYFVLWTGDEVPNWSDISNTTSTIPLAPIRSVTLVSGSPLAFGDLMTGDQVVASTGVVIRNDGTVPSTYIMRASTSTPGTPWAVSASTPAGPDVLVFFGAYDDATAPVLGDFGVEDVIGPSDLPCTGTRYTVTGAITGDNVPAGEDRRLWIRLDMPTTTRTTVPQALKIEITAQPP